MTDLPKSKYSDPLHTPGKEFTLGEKEYVGWYIVTYQDRYFTGKVLNKSSKEIFPIPQINSQPIRENVFVAQERKPSDQDRLTGTWKRYFIQNIKSRVVIEVSKIRYDAFNNTPGFKRGIVNWLLKGPAQDVTKGTYVYKGAANKNKEAVEKLEFSFPGISSYFKNYSEFVE